MCGDVRFVNERGTNQEGLYWRYEMALRALESRVRSVTGGNGAIYATRRDSYLVVDPIMGHDLSFPFNMVKRGWLALYVPDARASEKMVPTIEGEFARKRRMMSHGWPIVLRGGMLSPRGYDPLYALMIFSHRILRYLSPFLHLIALGTSIALLGSGWVYVAAVAAQGAVLLAALLAPVVPRAPAAGRALLRADDRVAGRGPVGLARARHAGGLGAGRGDAMSESLREFAASQALIDIVLAAIGSVVSAPLVALLAVAIRLESPRPSDLPPDARRQGRRAVLDLQAADDGARRRVHRRRAGDPGGRRPDHARRRAAAALLARRAAEPMERGARGDVDRRATPNNPGPGRAVHRAPARPPRREARDHRLGAGQRSGLAAMA